MAHLLISVIAVLVAISLIPTALSQATDVDPANFNVPSWIKNNAGWWADGLIDDNSFVSGIQWLILNDVITIQSTQQGTTDVDNVIPSWVKSTAGWWAEDKIEDITFVSAIRYLINEGIMIIEQEPEEFEEPVEEVVEEAVETRDFYMEVNSGSCFSCVSWAHVGQQYNFLIETYDEKRGSYIDGVKINVKIISKDGKLRHNFGQVTTSGGIYEGSIVIPSIDWFDENILSVSAEYYGVEKTVGKDFTVFAKRAGAGPSSQPNTAGSCTEVSPLAVNSKVGWPGYTYTAGETSANGLTFSEDGNKMFVVGKDNDVVSEYILGGSITNSSGTFSFSGPYCLGTAHKISAFNIGSQTTGATGIAFNTDGLKMFIVGEGGNDKVYEYTLTENFVTNGTGTGYGLSTGTTFVDAFDVSSQDNSPQGIAFSPDGLKMFIVGDQNDSVFQYTLSENFDVSTAFYADKKLDVDATVTASGGKNEDSPQGIAFSPDGLKMFIAGKERKSVHEFNLSENFDVSTAFYADTFDVSGAETKPREIAFDHSGRYMFILGTQGNDVTVYKLSENFDVSTAVVQTG
jgi:hypothetical protein